MISSLRPTVINLALCCSLIAGCATLQGNQLSPGASPVVNTKLVSSSPGKVRPGDTIKIVMHYSVMTQAPAGTQSVDVEESWVLKKGGEVLANLAPQRGRRAVGRYAAEASIKVPVNATPGTYVIEHKVQAGKSYDVDQSVFIVAR